MSERLAQATVLAEKLHRGQLRKGTTIPYVSHLYAVASLVMEWGGDEDVVIAGLLHDAVDDCGELPTAELIRQQFGDRVADAVLACSDSTDPDWAHKASWLERKRAHIEEIAHTSADAALVTAADKLHNMRSLVRDLREEGPSTLSRFKEPDHVLWYYKGIIQSLRNAASAAIRQELEQTLIILQHLTQSIEH